MENSSFYFDLQEIVSAFMVLFAVIDVTGLLPVFIDFQNKGMKISPIKAAIYSLIAFVAFLFVGNGILQLFQVDISSFAVAGSLVIFVMAVEMVLGIEIFHNDGPVVVEGPARYSHRAGVEYRYRVFGFALCIFGREGFRESVCVCVA